jgi:hypothetical protein
MNILKYFRLRMILSKEEIEVLRQEEKKAYANTALLLMKEEGRKKAFKEFGYDISDNIFKQKQEIKQELISRFKTKTETNSNSSYKEPLTSYPTYDDELPPIPPMVSKPEKSEDEPELLF